MTRSEYVQFHQEFCQKMQEVTQRKNSDYCGLNPSPFANFSTVEIIGITDTERGFLVRMTDKMARIISFVQKGELQVKDESVQDTLLDLANYSVLLAAYIQSKK